MRAIQTELFTVGLLSCCSSCSQESVEELPPSCERNRLSRRLYRLPASHGVQGWARREYLHLFLCFPVKSHRRTWFWIFKTHLNLCRTLRRCCRTRPSRTCRSWCWGIKSIDRKQWVKTSYGRSLLFMDRPLGRSESGTCRYVETVPNIKSVFFFMFCKRG